MSHRTPRLLMLVLTTACDNEPAAVSSSTVAGVRPPLEVQAAVDKAVATTGDVITYTVDLEYDTTLEILFDEPGARIAGLRVIDFGQNPTEPKGLGRASEQRWYKLRADLVGPYVLPPLRVGYREQRPKADTADAKTEAPQTPSRFVETSAIFIEVTSVLPKGETPTDIRGLKPLRPMPSKGSATWLAAGGVVLLLALGALGWWRWRQRPVAIPKPSPPHEIAFSALESLRATDFNNSEETRLYFFRLSEVVRAYVEARFGVRATDMTREEIQTWIQGSSLDSEQRSNLGAFLTRTERIKFGGHPPDRNDIERAYEMALRFVETTAPLAEEAQAA